MPDPGPGEAADLPPSDCEVGESAPAALPEPARPSTARGSISRPLLAALSFVGQGALLVLMAVALIAIIAIVADDPEPDRSLGQSAWMRLRR